MLESTYASTLRLPVTSMPFRALDASVPGMPPGTEMRRRDVALLASALGPGHDSAAYASLRSCARFMLGCLAHAPSTHPPAAVPPLEAYMHALLDRVEQDGSAPAAVAFARDDLMAFYLDARKDALYCDPASEPRRLSSLAFLSRAFSSLARMAEGFAPMLAAEMRFHGVPSGKGFPATVPDGGFMDGWEAVREVRDAARRALEAGRAAKAVSSSYDAELVLLLPDGTARRLAASGWEPLEVLPVARVETGRAPDGELHVSLRPSPLPRCARSMRRTPDIGLDPRWPDVSARDARALGEAACAA